MVLNDPAAQDMVERLTEICRPPRRHNLPVRPALEDDRILARALTVRESTNSLCGLVLEARKKLMEVRDAESFEEPLPSLGVSKCGQQSGSQQSEKKASAMIRLRTGGGSEC